MTNQENQDNQDTLSFALAREIKQLNPEIQPSRDLWPAIERAMDDHQQPSEKKYNWMPYSVAASLFIAVSALLSNIVLMNQSPVAVQQNESFAVNKLDLNYLNVRNTLKSEFEEKNKLLPAETLDDLNQNLDILENARLEIEQQIRDNPNDQKLVELLMRVHAQEIELLKQDYTKPGRFI